LLKQKWESVEERHMTTSPKRSVKELVAGLASSDATARMKARQALVQHGSSAVAALLATLAHPEPHVRWEAAKALKGIADPSSAEKLIEVLDDPETDVRWVAGDALAAIGRASLAPIMYALLKGEQSEDMYKATHHVLHDFGCQSELTELVRPVARALNQPEPHVYVPLAAAKALEELKELD
jgi:HEAT repeat protein